MSAPGHGLARPSVVDELASALRARILAGELEAGTPLREAELSEAYGVSRHTLRAALRALAGDGLAEIVPNRGVRVAHLGDAELRGLFELRTALELEACTLALARHDGRLPPSVHEALDRLVACCRRRDGSWRAVADAHAGFHGAIVAAGESPRIAEAYGRLSTELALFLVRLRPVWPLRRMIEHHRTLVCELEATGDIGALRRHLADGLTAVVEAGPPADGLDARGRTS